MTQQSTASYYVRLYKAVRILLTIQVFLVTDRSAGNLAAKSKVKPQGLLLSDFVPLLLWFSASFGFFIFVMCRLLKSLCRPRSSVFPSNSGPLKKPSSSSSIDIDCDASASIDDSTSKLDRKPDLFLQGSNNRSQSLEQSRARSELKTAPQTSQRQRPEFGFIFLSCFYFGANILSIAVVFAVVRYSRDSNGGKRPLFIALCCLLAYLLAGTVCLFVLHDRLWYSRLM